MSIPTYECEDGEILPFHKIIEYAQSAVWEASGLGTYFKRNDGKFYCVTVKLDEVTQEEINGNGPEKWHVYS